ncbi:MAG: hypothetical protein AB7O43_20190 [Hyphomicrobiaceae bacterium]
MVSSPGPRLILRSCSVVSITTAALLLQAGLPGAAHAQDVQNLPGLIVTAPPPGTTITRPPTGAAPPLGGRQPRAAPPPSSSPRAKAPTQRQTTKPKPKRSTKSASAAPSTSAAPGAGKGGGTRLALIVNGEAITEYDITQRAKLLGMQSGGLGGRIQENYKRLAKSKAVNEEWKRLVQATIEANQRSKTRDQIIAMIKAKQAVFVKQLQQRAVESARASVVPAARKKAREELIDEAIKRQAAKREGVSSDKAAVDAMIKQMASQNKMTAPQFADHFNKMGIDFATFRARFATQQAWVEVVRKKYGYLVNPNNRDIDRLLQGDSAGEDRIELQVQRVLIPLPSKLDQRAMAQHVAEAERLQRQFRDCRTTATLASKVDGARFEKLGTRPIASFGEPTRTLLASAKENEMIPPNITDGGIELLAVCNKNVIKASEAQRKEKANELRQQEFDRISRKYLRDLRAEAYIEER